MLWKPRRRARRTRTIGWLLVLALLAYFAGPPAYAWLTHASITKTVENTIVAKAGYLSSCQTLSKKGTYHLYRTIVDPSASGPCMNITASGVSIICGGKGIVGSGPYIDVPPFSYGIRAAGVKNLTVSGCAVSNFSYGVLMESVRGFRLLNSSIGTNFVSNLYLSNSSNGAVIKDYIYGPGGQQGGVLITNGSTGNKFSNDTIKADSAYGLYIDSSGNTYTSDYISASRASFFCTPKSGFPRSSSASAVVCYNETGCGFLSCSGSNIPLNVSKIALGKSIGTCGSISSAGSYALTGDLNFDNYSNADMASQIASGASCLRISAPRVTVNCNGHTISNAYIGISVLSDNVTVTDCAVSDSGIGVLMNGTIGSAVTGSTFTGDNVSIDLLNSTISTISNVRGAGGNSGIRLIFSPLNTVRNFTMDNSTYGIYLDWSLGNTFANGSALGNSRFDVFSAAGPANQSSNLMSRTACGLTNAQWATCAQRTTNSTSTYLPISTCTGISRPGKYILTQNLQAAPPNCIRIYSNNTSLDCQNFQINANLGTFGAGIVMQGRRNVSVGNCWIINYKEGVVVNNSAHVSITGINGRTLAAFGIEFNNVTNGTISGSALRGPSNETVLLNGVRGSTVSHNNVSYTTGHGVGIMLLNSTGDMVYNNTGQKNYVSIYLKGASQNNTVTNNTFYTSIGEDYQCDRQDSQLNAEYGSINHGASKAGCNWLVMIPYGAAPLDCPAFTASGLYSMTSDAVYYGGVICLTMLVNYSTVNCNGHTVLAVNGGTFARFLDSNASKIENCYLKGFTNPILATGSAVTVLNNTIYSTNMLNASAAAINITAAHAVKIINNRIITPFIGIRVGSVAGGAILNNSVLSPGGAAYQLNAFSYGTINNNTAMPGSGSGMTFANSIFDRLQGNNLNGVSGGLACTGASQALNDTDNGGNYCAGATKCAWLGSSKATC